MDPLERLLAATERLASDLATAAASHHDLHAPDPLGPVPVTDGSTGKAALGRTVPEAFAVATGTACGKADTGTSGRVRVGLPPSTYPVPIAAGCLAMAITPGQLPPAPATPVAHPAIVQPGEEAVEVSIDPQLPVGLYLGHLVDQSGSLQRPFAIYLDGLP